MSVIASFPSHGHHSSKPPPPLFTIFLTFAFVSIIYYAFFYVNEENQSIMWVRHSRHTDAVKVLVPYSADVADMKKVVKRELAPAIDQESLGQVLLLSTKLGRLKPDMKIKKVAGREKILIVFVDNVASRLHLKMLTSDQVPIQVNNPFCLKTDDAYIAVAKVLAGDYSHKDIKMLKKNLCESSVESWS